MRSLIAEPDAAAREQMLAVLSRYGSCDVVETGDQALAAFFSSLDDNRRYDVICLGRRLPDVEGHGLLKAIRAAEKSLGWSGANEVPVLIATDDLQPREIIGGFYYGGCTDFVVKPIGEMDLVRTLTVCGVIGDRRRLEIDDHGS